MEDAIFMVLLTISLKKNAQVIKNAFVRNMKKENPMNNGCPKCAKISGPPKYPGDHGICLDCQLEQADADVLQAMNRRAELERKKAKLERKKAKK